MPSTLNPPGSSSKNSRLSSGKATPLQQSQGSSPSLFVSDLFSTKAYAGHWSAIRIRHDHAMELGLGDLGAGVVAGLRRSITSFGRVFYDGDGDGGGGGDSNGEAATITQEGFSCCRKRKAPSPHATGGDLESAPSFWKRFRAAFALDPGPDNPLTSSVSTSQSEPLFRVPLIMNKVSRSIPEADLLRLRLTCRLWHSAMSSELRRSHCSSVRVEGECALVVKRLGQLAGTLTSGNGLIPSPMSKFTIVARRGSGAKRRVFSHPGVRHLFSVWGPAHLTRLEVQLMPGEPIFENLSKRLYATGLRRVIFNLTPALVQLSLSSYFVLNEPPVENGTSTAEDVNDDAWNWQELPRLRSLELGLGTSEESSQLARDLLRAATGLEALSLQLGCTLSWRDPLRFLLQNPTASPSLRRLTLGTIYEDNLALLTELSRRSPNGLRLQTLSGILASTWGEAEPRLSTLLSLQAEWLSHLSLQLRGSYLVTPGAVVFSLPSLPALRNLQISAPVRSLSVIRFATSAYPNLKQFSFKYEPFYPTAWSQLLASLATSPVTELTLDGELESVELLEDLAAHFPGVTRLTIGLRVECLPHIWGKWPGLEFLDVRVHGARDEGEPSSLDADLTGIGREQCVTLRQQLARGEINIEQALAGLKTAPGLLDLKNLRELRLSFGYGSVPEENVLTDVSGYLAFAFAAPGSGSRLQRISVAGGKSNISDECRAAIRERLGLGSLISI